MDRCSAVVSPQRSWCLFSVPSRNGERVDRIIVFDYFRGLWWLWSAPFGVKSMAVDYDELGRERVLIGTYDGFVMSLTDALTDDGAAINAYAVSPVIQPFGGMKLSAGRLIMSVRELGSQASMTLDILADDSIDRVLHTRTIRANKGYLTWNQSNWISSEGDYASRWTEQGQKLIEAAIPQRNMHRFAFRISGTSKWSMRYAELIAKPRARRGFK